MHAIAPTLANDCSRMVYVRHPFRNKVISLNTKCYLCPNPILLSANVHLIHHTYTIHDYKYDWTMHATYNAHILEQPLTKARSRVLATHIVAHHLQPATELSLHESASQCNSQLVNLSHSHVLYIMLLQFSFKQTASMYPYWAHKPTNFSTPYLIYKSKH